MAPRFVKYVTSTVLGTAAFTIYSNDAQAFFPPIIPDQNVVVTPPTTNPIIPIVPPVIVAPVDPNPIRPLPPPTVVPRPLPPPVHCDCPPNMGNHCAIPEPTTIVSGLFGLGTVGLAAWRRKRKGDAA